MSEHRQALEKIMRICAESRTYSRRTQTINNEAMRALGMTASQRHEVHMRIFERVGDTPLQDAYLKRREKARAKLATYMLDAHGVEINADSDELAEQPA